MSSPLDDMEIRRWRANLLGLLLAMTFTGGALVGLIISSLSLSAVWVAALLLGATGVFLAVVRPRDRG